MRDSIKQEDDFGCGIACVAFVLSKTYRSVINEKIELKAKTRGFLCRELTAILKENGYLYSYHYLKACKKRDIKQEGTIVYIQKSKRYPDGHYLTRHKDYWMDPWINLQRDGNLSNAISGYRRKLPGKAIYYLLPTNEDC